MNRLLTLAAVCSVAIPLIGCGDDPNEYADEAAQALCDHFFECKDSDELRGDMDACLEMAVAIYEAETTEQQAKGREYDSECALKMVERYESAQCDGLLGSGPADEADAACKPRCDPWHGSLSAGMECEFQGDCGKGLECSLLQGPDDPNPRRCVNRCAGAE